MPSKTLLKEFEKGLPYTIYFLWSVEAFFLDDAVSRFTETVIDTSTADFNYDVFYPSSSPQDILNAASTLPFMAKRRLVVLKDFHQFPAASIKALAPYFREPAETTCMVVLSQKKPPAVLSDIEWKLFSLNIHERDVPSWLKQEAARKGIKLSDEAVNCLIEYAGYEIGLLTMEIEKLSSMGSRTISGKDVISSMSMTREFTTFDLVDSLVSGQSSRAFRILNSLFSGKGDLPVIIGTLNWHYKQFYSLWANKGKRPARMWEKTYRALGKFVPSFTEEDFYRIFQCLHEADLELKSSGRPELVLEVLLLKLLQKSALN